MIRAAQLLLLLAAAGLWAASRLTWASVQSFDGLGQPKTVTVDGAAWSTALVPMALLLAAAALAALAVRGWLLRVVSVLVAVASLALGYLGIGLIVMPDIGPRAAALSDVPVIHLVGSQRYLAGASITVVAAVLALLAAVLLMRAAASAAHTANKYATTRDQSDPEGADTASERGMWDALDAGRDPTDNNEGR
ncbi:MAG: TIGR02234 family membrane protein [Actinomycetes bacterium]